MTIEEKYKQLTSELSTLADELLNSEPDFYLGMSDESESAERERVETEQNIGQQINSILNSVED